VTDAEAVDVDWQRRVSVYVATMLAAAAVVENCIDAGC